ncbi:MAG: type 1 glutamine amidotransferase, partial [Desulfuromonadaceae bacterium]
PEVPPGNLTDHLTIPYIIHHPYRSEMLPQPAQISALIVLGGAMGANDDQHHPFLGELKSLIRTILAARTPYLGICLGGQLLAAALGAEVVSNRWEELGTQPVHLTEQGKTDRLFRGIPERFGTFQWHHDSFDIPAGGMLLASSAACPHQAFRVGEAAWGLQFHPEVTENIIRVWCAWDSGNRAKTEGIVAAFKAEAGSYGSTARLLMKNFLASTLL